MVRVLMGALALLVSLSCARAAEMVGMIEFDVAGDRALHVHALYPAQDGGKAEAFGGNAVWASHTVHVGARPKGTGHPLVVLSHGMFGNRFNQTWLAVRLARAGYIVLAFDHPGTSTWSREPELSRQLWERPRDIARVIDGFLASPKRAAAIDADAIYAVGHSLGGFTVLAAAGARFDVDRYTELCGQDPQMAGCTAFEKLGVSPDDRTGWERDVTEPRLKAVVALDPGGTQGFSVVSLARMDVPVMMIAGGRTPEIVDRADEAERIERLLPPQILTYLPLDEAGHFDFLGICTENGLEILREEEPDDVFVCERGTQDRMRLHEQIADAIIAFLAEH
jgi:predicted dienelactone hydrolase